MYCADVDVLLCLYLSGFGPQGRAECDGGGGSDLSADLPAVHSCGADAGEDVSLGRLRSPLVAKACCQTAILTTPPHLR